MAIHYYRPDFTEQHARLMIADYVADLLEFSVADIEAALREHRHDSKAKFFPQIGELRERCLKVKRNRQIASEAATAGERLARRFQKANGYPLPARPILWWMIPRDQWPQNWREEEVPMSEKIRETRNGAFRLPERLI